jgi:hypothetical protein
MRIAILLWWLPRAATDAAVPSWNGIGAANEAGAGVFCDQ